MVYGENFYRALKSSKIKGQLHEGRREKKRKNEKGIEEKMCS